MATHNIAYEYNVDTMHMAHDQNFKIVHSWQTANTEDKISQPTKRAHNFSKKNKTKQRCHKQPGTHYGVRKWELYSCPSKNHVSEAIRTQNPMRRNTLPIKVAFPTE